MYKPSRNGFGTVGGGEEKGWKFSYSPAEEKGKENRKKSLREEEWEVGLCLVCRLVIHKVTKMLFHFNQAGKLRTWSFEHHEHG